MWRAVEVRGRLFHLEDVDRRGEQVVETLEEPLRWEAARGVEVGDLGKGVDAGVGPSRPLNLHRRPEELPCGVDQGSLDAPGVLLHLPAAVTGPVILQREFVFAAGRGGNRFPNHGFVSCFAVPFSGGSPRRVIPSRPERRPARGNPDSGVRGRDGAS